jgi:F0F1-type ATP synthase assembly protein I
MPKKDDLLAQFSRYSGLAFLLPASILVGYVIGYFLDKAFGTTYLTVVFLFLGIISGMIELIRELNKDDAGK